MQTHLALTHSILPPSLLSPSHTFHLHHVSPTHSILPPSLLSASHIFHVPHVSLTHYICPSSIISTSHIFPLLLANTSTSHTFHLPPTSLNKPLHTQSTSCNTCPSSSDTFYMHPTTPLPSTYFTPDTTSYPQAMFTCHVSPREVLYFHRSNMPHIYPIKPSVSRRPYIWVRCPFMPSREYVSSVMAPNNAVDSQARSHLWIRSQQSVQNLHFIFACTISEMDYLSHQWVK